MMLALLLVTAFGQDPGGHKDPTELNAVYDALGAGNIEAAIRLAERYATANPKNSVAFLAVGDAYAARPVVGRFAALKAYRRARELALNDPEPSYRMVLLAFRLGGADGERIAREELERILALDPLYKDAWERWLQLYRNAGGRRKVLQSLRAYDSMSAVKPRIAQLLIEGGAYHDANRVLDGALAADSVNPELLALRAQSALEAGDTTVGTGYYHRALAHAEHDSNDVLWKQVIGIASPAEIRAWPAVPPRARGEWLEGLWARRNPNLFAGTNRRIGEHFARLRYARERFPLLHPLAIYHRSALGRTLNLEPSQAERAFHQRCEMTEVQTPYEGGRIPAAPVTPVRERQRASLGVLSHLTPAEQDRALREHPRLRAEFAPTIYAPLGMDLREVDSSAARIGYNVATGLDDRGIMYLRFGAPQQALIGGNNPADPQCTTDELERWRYDRYGEVRFARPNAFSRGERSISEMVFRPMNETQFASMSLGLTRDGSSEPAPLAFGVWTVQFAGAADPTSTDLVVISSKGEIAASAVTDAGTSMAAQARGGIVIIPSVPGRHVLLAHARIADSLGRQTFSVRVRSFNTGPALSDLLVTPAWHDATTGPTRQDLLAHLDRDLTFPAGATWRAYAEAYGLAGDTTYNYHATYRLLRSGNVDADLSRDDWPQAITIEFDRSGGRNPGEAVSETVNLTPQILPPGRYLLRLEIRDNVTGLLVGRATTVFEVL